MIATSNQSWTLPAGGMGLLVLVAALGWGCSIERSGLRGPPPRDAAAEGDADSDADDAGDAPDATPAPDAGCSAIEACTPGDDDCDGIVDEGCDFHFGRPSPLVSLHRSTGAHYSPVLSVDGRRLYYRADVEGGPDLWVASRAGVEARFGPPAPVEILGAGDLAIYSFTLSDDELELIAEARAPASTAPTRLHRATRDSTGEPFGMPREVEALSATLPWRDYNPHLSRAGTEILFVSNRNGQDRIWRATRPDPGLPFGAPEMVTLPGLSSVETTPHLSRDGLTLFFARDWRIWAAERSSTSTATFGEPRKIEDLPDDGGTYFPHVSESTYEMFFVSERPWSPASIALWRARICRDGPCDEPVIDCPMEGRLSPDQRHCYFEGGTSAGWAEARSDCLAAGGDLVSIHSHGEQELAWSLTMAEAWTGGNDMASECNISIPNCSFVWSTGEPFLYDDWPPGQPNDTGGEDCMVINANIADRFNDRACTVEMPFVCERELWPW